MIVDNRNNLPTDTLQHFLTPYVTHRLGTFSFVFAQILLLQASVHGAEWQYSVRRGDTLIGIAKRHLTDPAQWVDLQKLNAVRNPRRLPPNSILRIPVEWLREVPSTATVAQLQGNVSIMRGAEDKLLAVGDTLVPGDVVKTAENGSLLLHFSDGSKALLLKNSTPKLDRLGAYAHTNMSATELQLEHGRVESKVTPFTGAASRYEIRTPMAQLGVRGTDFRAGIDDASQSSSSEVLEGGVAALANNATVNVPKGFGARVAQGQAPSPPVELLPAPDLSTIPALIDRTPIRFRWAANPTAGGYRVQIEREKLAGAIFDEALFRAPEASFPDLPDGRYALRVRAIDANGLEGYNALREVIIKARPEPPFLQSPEDQITVRGDRPKFVWAKVAEAAQYHFQLARDAAMSVKLFDEGASQSNEFIVAKPLPPGDYFWRVASRRASGDLGPFGDIQQFTLKAIPIADGNAKHALDDKRLTLQWKSGSPGQTFQLQLARNREFSPLLKEEKLVEPKIQLQRPAGGVIYMRVKAIDSDGYEGPYGAAQEISVAPNYPAIQLTADHRTAKFAWAPVLDGQKIHLQVARTARFEPALLDTTTDATEAEIQRPVGSEFFVRSRRIDRDGYVEEFSMPARFSVSEPFAQLDSPTFEKGQLKFKWSAPLPGQQFQVQVARDEAFHSIVHNVTQTANYLALKSPGAGRYFVRVGVIDPDGFVAPYGPTQQVDVARNYWPFLLFLPLLLL